MTDVQAVIGQVNRLSCSLPFAAAWCRKKLLYRFRKIDSSGTNVVGLTQRVDVGSAVHYGRELVCG